MTVFYAYIHNILDDNKCRVIMVFPNRSVADEWWRAISGSDCAPHFQRLNSQFYSRNPEERNILGFFTNERFKSISGPFRGKMFMTLLDDRSGRNLPIIPNQECVDHCSGNWFYIRSKSNPSLYWYLLNGRIRISSTLTQRTQFQIRGRDLTTGTIMIGSDSVTFQPNGDSFVYVDESGSLVESGIVHNFRFDDLEKGSFWIQPDHGLRFDLHREPAQHCWELV
ncbi:hypothetical protein BJ165DRAFT_1365769 [Panaeolus papilionaceus]|nr:hypothetical protein BJ165DRAFT_1365769 [Panaeolus papilionaceus]